jgi:hypothetical protein
MTALVMHTSSQVNPDYTRRPEPEDMLRALRRTSAITA